MEGPNAAHSQYLFGEKHKAVMISLWSKVWRCLPSFKSHSIALQSCKMQQLKYKYDCALWYIRSPSPQTCMDNVNVSKKIIFGASHPQVTTLMKHSSASSTGSSSKQHTWTTPNRSLTELTRFGKNELDDGEEDFHSTPLTVPGRPWGWGLNGMLQHNNWQYVNVNIYGNQFYDRCTVDTSH
jgi:hypothetical protein